MTSDEHGAQRVAWTPTWQKARDWFAAKAREAGAEVTVDTAGNSWAKIAGVSPDAVAFGSHLDCVPNGGWLDGALGAVVTLEVLRRYDKGATPKKTIYAVSWADEEGARFGRSLIGSSAASGTLDIADIIDRVDNQGVKLTDLDRRERGMKFMPRLVRSILTSRVMFIREKTVEISCVLPQ